MKELLVNSLNIIYHVHNSYRIFFLLPLILVLVWAGCKTPTKVNPAEKEARMVKIVESAGQYTLTLDGTPFFVKGAGCEFGSIDKLAQHGANSFRTWRTDNGKQSGKEILDLALEHNLMVLMGLDMGKERHGFDYSDSIAVKKQFEIMKSEILKYKDHPALLGWGIGNELNLRYTNPEVWSAVNDVARFIKKEDPRHVSTTMLAGMDNKTIHEIEDRAPALDFLSIQLYGALPKLPMMLKESGYDGPYMVTEWGATGHWEVKRTSWDVPIEQNSSVKAERYMERYLAVIAADTMRCLGSYVFLWGQKQERTPTWYGMFLESGEQTEAVDKMHYLWTGEWPGNTSPKIKLATIDGKTAYENIYIRGGEEYAAAVSALDMDGDSLSYYWEILPESTDLGDGGDPESKPDAIAGLIREPANNQISFKAPQKPGPYRLFVYVFDQQDHAAHANIPFFVN